MHNLILTTGRDFLFRWVIPFLFPKLQAVGFPVKGNLESTTSPDLLLPIQPLPQSSSGRNRASRSTTPKAENPPQNDHHSGCLLPGTPLSQYLLPSTPCHKTSELTKS